MTKDALTRLRQQLDLALNSGTGEAEAELAAALAEALRQLAPEPGADSEGWEHGLAALEAAWFKAAAPPADLPGTPEQQARLARLLSDILAAQGFALALSKGDLSERLRAKGMMTGALKALQANLRHLTWQTQMIAQGDFSQRVDFMGEFSESFNAMVHSLAASRDQLLAANQDLEAFSYSVSHDLRAPLRVIEGFSRILLKDQAPGLDAEGRRHLGVIIDNARLMGRLIDDILAFARLGRRQVKKTDLDLTGLARSIAAELQGWAADRHLEVTVQELPPAYGDPALLRQVLVNLLSNAIKFTAPRDPARIEVGGLVDGPDCTYYVKDNGVGFDMEQADRLFGVFQRLHGPTEFEGSGVGLAIVHKIIQRHGGRVWAEGRVNKGATIYFSLPQPPPSP